MPFVLQFLLNEQYLIYLELVLVFRGFPFCSPPHLAFDLEFIFLSYMNETTKTKSFKSGKSESL